MRTTAGAVCESGSGEAGVLSEAIEFSRKSKSEGQPSIRVAEMRAEERAAGRGDSRAATAAADVDHGGSGLDSSCWRSRCSICCIIVLRWRK